MRIAPTITAEQARAEVAALSKMTLPAHEMAEQMHFLACLRPPTLWEFTTDYGGKANGFTQFGKFHRELCNFAETCGRMTLFLVSRGHYKSTILTVYEALRRCLYYYPNHLAWEKAGGTPRPAPAPGIMSYSLELSRGFVEKIRAICETDFMRRMFPTVIPANQNAAPGSWTNERLTFLNGTSITAYTAKSLPTGQHTGDLFVDDLVTKESVNTGELITNTQEVYAQLLSILDPDGTMWMIGTRYSHLDQYGKILKSEDWDRFIRPCYDPNGDPIFPEKFTRQALELIEREQGPYTFSCQFLLEPVPSDEQVFRPEWIRHDAPTQRRGGTVTICVDPAISMAENACSTGITAVESTSVAGQIHRDLRERLRARLNPSQLVEATLNMAERFDAVEIGIEAIQYQASIRHYMEIEMRRRGRYFKVTEIKSYKGRAKLDRIKGLQPEFSRGLYHLLPDQIDVAQELISFPQGAEVDVIDSMAMHQELESYQSVSTVGLGLVAMRNAGNYRKDGPPVASFANPLAMPMPVRGLDAIAARNGVRHG